MFEKRTASYNTFDWRVMGLALACFLSVGFVLCVSFDLLFPGRSMYESWMKLLPGFTWLTWESFFLGLAESFAYGIYIALVFCPLYNTFSSLFATKSVDKRNETELVQVASSVKCGCCGNAMLSVMTPTKIPVASSTQVGCCGVETKAL